MIDLLAKLKIHISIIILLFINFIFCYKYSSRYTEFGFLFSITLLLIQLSYFYFGKRILLSKPLIIFAGYSALALLLGLVLFIHFKIPPESLNVDRWSVISSFLSEMFNGNYPYYAKSHMGNYPGPMPIYFLIALPFHLMGELSILSSLGYIIILLFLIKEVRNTSNMNFVMFYLFTSLFLLWELIVRSNIFTFSLLIVVLLQGFTNLKNHKHLTFYILAILAGLLLATRSVFILVYIVFFLSSLITRK